MNPSLVMRLEEIIPFLCIEEGRAMFSCSIHWQYSKAVSAKADLDSYEIMICLSRAHLYGYLLCIFINTNTVRVKEDLVGGLGEGRSRRAGKWKGDGLDVRQTVHSENSVADDHADEERRVRSQHEGDRVIVLDQPLVGHGATGVEHE